MSKKPSHKTSEELMADILAASPAPAVLEPSAAASIPTDDALLATARVVLGALLSRQAGLPDPDKVAENAMRYAVALHIERPNWGV